MKRHSLFEEFEKFDRDEINGIWGTVQEIKLIQ